MEEVKFNATKYKNQFAKENYEFIRLNIPKGMKSRIKDRADALEVSVNKYIRDLIYKDLETFGEKEQALRCQLLECHATVNAMMYKPPFRAGYTLTDKRPEVLGTFSSREEAIAAAEGKAPSCSAVESGSYHIVEYFIEECHLDEEGSPVGEPEYIPIMRYEKIWPGAGGLSTRNKM